MLNDCPFYAPCGDNGHLLPAAACTLADASPRASQAQASLPPAARPPFTWQLPHWQLPCHMAPQFKSQVPALTSNIHVARVLSKLAVANSFRPAPGIGQQP